MVGNASWVDDGILTARYSLSNALCEVCGSKERCITLGPKSNRRAATKIQLPEGIKIESTIMWDKERSAVRRYIGIGCGCYAKFHRQIAHITDNIKRREEAATL